MLVAPAARFRRHADGLAEQKTFGEQGLKLTRRVFAAWRAYQHEHHDRDRLKREIAPIQTELRQLLEAASPKSARTRWHRRFANNLLKVWPALWTFTTTDGVEPTNNPAERALRAPVIHRKFHTPVCEGIADAACELRRVRTTLSARRRPKACGSVPRARTRSASSNFRASPARIVTAC